MTLPIYMSNPPNPDIQMPSDRNLEYSQNPFCNSQPIAILYPNSEFDILILIEFETPNPISTQIGFGDSDNYYQFGNTTPLHFSL